MCQEKNNDGGNRKKSRVKKWARARRKKRWVTLKARQRGRCKGFAGKNAEEPRNAQHKQAASDLPEEMIRSKSEKKLGHRNA